MFSAHQMGGCPMGSDPRRSVVDARGRHHQIGNLFIADGSIFPTSLGVNPQLSIYAHARLFATEMARKGHAATPSRTSYSCPVTLAIRDDVPLAPLTTLELGGPARHFVEARDDDTVVEALRWADARGLPVLILGGGSNMVVADAGFDGLVVRIATRGRRFDAAGGHA